MSDFTQERSGHWYSADGKPCHTQPDGKKTTLRHARKQILYPSVTSILSIIPKHTVDDWRVEQAVLATMQCMVQEGASTLTAQEMMAKVASRLEDATSAGRRFGSEMHSVIEYINKYGQVPPPLSPLSSLHPEHAAKYWTWLRTSGIEVTDVELAFIHSYDGYGYGGCIDLVGKRRIEGQRSAVKVIVDFKTQKVKDRKPKFYPEWAYQLAAYRNKFEYGHIVKCMSVVIDSETGEIWEQVWPDEAIDKAFTTFNRAFMLWMSVRDYYPYLENTRRAEPAPVLFSEVAGWAGLDMEVGNRTATEVNASALTVAQVRAAQEQMNQMVEEYQRWPAPTPTPSSPIFSGAWEDRPTIRH
jgi:hypothetical protein